MIDLRYHVYSLAAIIVALAIGFVFGTSSSGKHADMKQVERIVNRYQSTATSLKTELDEMDTKLAVSKSDLSRSEKLCAALIPQALGNKLVHRNIAIIQTGDYDSLATDVKAVLLASGAKVSSITRISPTFRFDDPNQVVEALEAAKITPIENESGRTAILRTLSELLCDGRNQDKVTELENKGVLSLSGDYTKWNRLIVIIGGTSSAGTDRAERVDLALIPKLEALGAVVVGCEPSNARTSYVPAWQRSDISTVDNADLCGGKVSLVCALTGESGHFGQKRTADKQLPDSLGSNN